jgi:hypothetical protein
MIIVDTDNRRLKAFYSPRRHEEHEEKSGVNMADQRHPRSII